MYKWLTRKIRPNQPNQKTAAECALYCQNRIGDYYRSFGVYGIKSNLTSEYTCECYDSGVGSLRLLAEAIDMTSATFYDTACFDIEC